MYNSITKRFLIYQALRKFLCALNRLINDTERIVLFVEDVYFLTFLKYRTEHHTTRELGFACLKKNSRQRRNLSLKKLLQNIMT